MPFLYYMTGLIVLVFGAGGVLVLGTDPAVARSLGIVFGTSLAISATASAVVLALVLWAFGRIIELLGQIAERMPGSAATAARAGIASEPLNVSGSGAT